MEKLVLKFRSKFVLAAFFSLLTGCGGPLESQKDADGLDEYAVVNGTFSQKDQKSVNGTGIVRFLTTAAAVNSHRTFSFHASLPATNSAVTLIAFAATKELTDGIQVRFLRSGGAVNVAIGIAGWGGVNVRAAATSTIDANNADLLVEVANDANNPRILIWKGETEQPTASNAIVDTALPSQLQGTMPFGNGTGVNMGFRLDNASVTRARLRQNIAP